jgi:type II secretory pathway pseudopilin PulG
MICRYCAAEIADGSQFCSKCGAPLGTQAIAPPVPPPMGAQTSGKAIASLICGCLFFIFPAAIVAVVLGHLALSEVRKSAGGLKGQGIATTGLVLGYSGVVAIPLILIIAAIAIPNLLRAKIAANEATAVGSVRMYNVALQQYSEMCQDRGYPVSPESLGPGKGDCDGSGLLDRTLASANPQKSGYVFYYRPGLPDASGHITRFTVNADPIEQNTLGMRYFFSDESGVIRWSTGHAASEQSPALR